MLEDLVAFDVVLGDLNFDNCSSGMEVNLPSFIHSYAKFQEILEILHCFLSLVFLQRTNWSSSTPFSPSTGTRVAWGQERTSRGLWVKTH